ncbi:MAG: hypothetical protein WBQ17_15365 [Rhizomicrobium sp.]
MTEQAISRVTTDKQPVDGRLAIIFEEVFGVPAEQFLDLQKAFDLKQARVSFLPDPGRAMRAKLFGDLPISEMIKRGWIVADDIRDTKNVEAELLRFFEVNRAEDIDIPPHSAKKSEADAPPTATQIAWLHRVKQIAKEMLVAPYSHQAASNAIAKLRLLTHSAEEIRKVPRILMECGIRFILVESLTSAKIDGVCFWLDDQSPVIGMTLRHDRIDNFWFVLRHELEHVLQMHGRERAMLDTELEGERAGVGAGVADDERVANLAAQEFCVPKSMMDAFIARKAPFYSEKDMIGFARTIKVHPGVVAGQLQHRTGRYDRFRNHLAKVREIVAPNAFKDGWGDVAPIGD